MLLVVSVAGYHYTTGPGLPARPVHEPSRSFTVAENAPNRAFSLLKAPTSVKTPDEHRAGHRALCVKLREGLLPALLVAAGLGP